MAIKIGISPIAWQNDDLPAMTADFTMDQALADSRDIGYLGVERGQRMPTDTEGFRAYLDRYDLALCGGWCSGGLLGRSVEDERAAMQAQVTQFVDLASPVLVYAECSNTVQGAQGTPVNARPKMTRDEVTDYARRLTEVAKWTADQGTPLSYHHHMGSMIEDSDDVDWLMDASGDALGLCFDTGHMRFGGGDVMAVLNRWSHRVNHVHFKDIRHDVTRRARDEDLSFLDAVIAGAFTVPGDGAIDFHAVAAKLKDMEYDGWIVVEAEQDPAKADPKTYSQMGYDHIRQVCDAAGLQVEGRA